MTVAPERPLRLGANYTPRRGWFHHWLDFDRREVADDFAALADLGLDHVRAFCLWPIFQPDRGLIRSAALDQLVTLVDAAADAGLDVAVDVLQGHLSSFDFLPAWTQTWHRRNLFRDPDVSAAQARLIAAVTSALAGHDAFLGTGIGNEVNQFTLPSHPQRDAVDVDVVTTWLTTTLQSAESAMPGGLHQHSFDDRLWFDDDSAFTPRHAVELGHITTVHSWVFMGTAQRYGAGHPALTHLASYLVELAAAWSPDPDRRVWLQEVGAPEPHVGADEASVFLDRTVRQAANSPELWGVTWWCSHDVARALLDFPELEYTLGLLDEHGAAKPVGEALAAIAADPHRSNGASAGPRPAVVFAADPCRRSATAPGSATFEAWLGLAREGRRPALVADVRSGDADYLARRGISEVVAAGDR